MDWDGPLFKTDFCPVLFSFGRQLPAQDVLENLPVFRCQDQSLAPETSRASLRSSRVSFRPLRQLTTR